MYSGLIQMDNIRISAGIAVRYPLIDRSSGSPWYSTSNSADAGISPPSAEWIKKKIVFPIRNKSIKYRNTVMNRNILCFIGAGF